MSFQGDVGGIGLAELLQSISRGRREGLLRLNSRGGLSCIIGMQTGVLDFLPDEDEDPQIWKDRSRQAWVNDQDFRIDAVRMSDIARAHRMERLFQMLDSEGVHFRFNPGETMRPQMGGRAEQGPEGAPNGARMPQVFCESMSVELFLLEYARLCDEARDAEGYLHPTDHIVPRVLDAGREGQPADRFLIECNGSSTLAEISDRMGMPMRQTRLILCQHERAGLVRLAGHRELLVLAQRELSTGHVWRAAARLVGWIQASPPGPLQEGDAQLLATEFRADRMGPLLNLMPSREARFMLRRLDHALQDPAASVRHWRELQRLKRKDTIIELHRLGAEFYWEEDAETPSLRELLDVARDLRESGHPSHAGAFLRMAASREPANANSRLDIGTGMVHANLIEEGAAWILDASQTLVATGHARKALPALRLLLEADPNIREARRMLGRLKHLTVRREVIRKNSLVGLGVVTLLASVGWVRISMERSHELKLAEVANLIESPEQAQSLLEEYFQDDESPRVMHLRELIVARHRFQEREHRNAWDEQYREAQLACSYEPIVAGLKLAMAIPPPPLLDTVEEPWPLIPDLFNGLAVRLESDHAALGELLLDGQEQVEAEQTLKTTVDAVLKLLADAEATSVTGDLGQRLELLSTDILQRTQDRARLLVGRSHQNLRSKQDLMLAAARADDRSGNLGEAILRYQRLIETDDSGRLKQILALEFSDLQRRNEALIEARKLASDGQHEEAIARMEKAFDDVSVYTLPWTLRVFPEGAKVHMRDGSSRSAPFIYESSPGEKVEFFIDYPGHSSRKLVVNRPHNVQVFLSKVPQRKWSRGGRVDALPVNVDEDQVVCDREGYVARITGGGESVWELELLSLGGIARAPVSLPERPEHLLLITEDGEAWLLNSRDGEVEGPWDLGSEPAEGPSATKDGVLARLKDGRLMRWTKRLRPDEVKRGQVPKEDHHGTLGGARVLQRGEAGAHFLDCPWNEWRVELQDEVYRVFLKNDPESGFTVLREGDWSYLAWEAPTPKVPNGRIWISDGAGLAGYVP